ncbi:MAG: pyridoxamine 5'-phosphate oxidase family protein [Pseudomonadota bacterium]
MKIVANVAELEAVYGEAVGGSLTKVKPALTPQYRRWIEAARFVVLTTVGPEGTDASPRGDAGPVARIVDDRTLMIPDWRGNNRMDSLRNIVRDGRVSLMFMVPGSNNVVRVNGLGVVTMDPSVTETFTQRDKHPRSVMVITIEELYFQCAKALMRSELWNPDVAADVPSAGDFLKEVDAIEDATEYDARYADYARPKMW